MERRTHDRRRRPVTTSLVAAAVLTALTGAPASADRAIWEDHSRFAHELHEVPQLTEACGFLVMHEESGNIIQRIHADGTEEIRLSVHERLIAPSSGEVLHHHGAGAVSVDGTFTRDGDRLVLDVERQHVGLPSMWRKSGQGVVLRDAGLAVLEVQVVLDVSQDPPVLVSSAFDTGSVHGPHPQLEMTTEEFHGMLCGALSSGPS